MMRSAWLAGLGIVTVITAMARAQGPEQVWTHEDGGESWIGYYVSLGNHGSQVFAHTSNYAMAALLLSCHDGDPPAPAWVETTWPDNPVDSDSARETDLHVSLTAVATPVPDHYVLQLRAFTSAGLLWSYTYPQDTSKKARVGVSNDGSRIMAAIYNPTSGGIDLVLLGPASPVPLAVHPLPSGVIWAFHLAGGGERVVLAIGDTAHIVDVASGALTFSLWFNYQLSGKGFALSADASLFVHGGNYGGTVRAWVWDGATYQHDFYYTPLGADPQNIVGAIAISDDLSTVALGISELYPSTKVQVEAFDVATRTMTMSETISSSGSYQNHVADVAIAADGSRFAAAQYGDEPDLVAEVRVYERHLSSPVFTLNLPGSAFNVDMSADGKWVVAGSKGVHANELGHGGRYDLIHMGDADLRVTTTPSAGATVDIELHGPAGSSAFLLFSSRPASPPVLLGAGTLYLDPASLFLVPLGPVGGGGVLSFPALLPADPALVGASVHLQGLTTAPERLTHDWVRLTLLP